MIIFFPKFYAEDIRKARKEHRCSECKKPICKGEKHHYCVGKWDSKISQFRQHLDCYDLLRELEKWSACCIAFGETEHYLDEYRRDMGYKDTYPYRKPDGSIEYWYAPVTAEHIRKNRDRNKEGLCWWRRKTRLELRDALWIRLQLYKSLKAENIK